MLVKAYLSMQETIDFVFELTGEKISHSTLEELSNVETLTPVFLFSGYVGYPDEATIRYDQMKAYFTHDDFFMHQTRNYENSSMYGDCDVQEWIEIYSPFTIQSIIKNRGQEYSVFDEVFLFINPPIGEIDKLDDLKYSRIDFDEVRFSKNELISVFGINQNKKDDLPSNVNQANQANQQLIDSQKKIAELKQEVEYAKNTDSFSIGKPTVAHGELKTNKQLNQELIAANIKIADLESQLIQATSNDDKSLYTTPAISIMNEVIKEFWINYSPDQPAPKQSTITNWIMGNFKGIAPALALNIDKVCRHSSARSGGKYKR